MRGKEREVQQAASGDLLELGERSLQHVRQLEAQALPGGHAQERGMRACRVQHSQGPQGLIWCPGGRRVAAHVRRALRGGPKREVRLEANFTHDSKEVARALFTARSPVRTTAH